MSLSPPFQLSPPLFSGSRDLSSETSGPPEAKNLSYFGCYEGGNAPKEGRFGGPPRAPGKRGYNRYTRGESPPQAENFSDFGPSF